MAVISRRSIPKCTKNDELKKGTWRFDIIGLCRSFFNEERYAGARSVYRQSVALTSVRSYENILMIDTCSCRRLRLLTYRNVRRMSAVIRHEGQRRLSGNVFSFVHALRAIKMQDRSIVTHSRCVSVCLRVSRLKYFTSIFRLFLREGIPRKWLNYFCKRIQNAL